MTAEDSCESPFIKESEITWPLYFQCCQSIPGQIITNAFGLTWRHMEFKIQIIQHIINLHISDDEWKDIISMISKTHFENKPYDMLYNNVDIILQRKTTPVEYLNQWFKEKNFNLPFALIEILCVMEAAQEKNDEMMNDAQFICLFKMCQRNDSWRSIDEEKYAKIFGSIKTDRHEFYCSNQSFFFPPNPGFYYKERNQALIDEILKKEKEALLPSYYSYSLYAIITQTFTQQPESTLANDDSDTEEVEKQDNSRKRQERYEEEFIDDSPKRANN